MADSFAISVNRLRAKLKAQPGFRVVGGEGGPSVLCPTCHSVIYEARLDWLVDASSPCVRCLGGGSAA